MVAVTAPPRSVLRLFSKLPPRIPKNISERCTRPMDSESCRIGWLGRKSAVLHLLLTVFACVPSAGAATWNLKPTSGDFLDTGDTIYETNYRSNTIGLFSLAGSDLGIFGTPSYPTGLAFDNSGNLYASSDDPAAYAILKYTPDRSVSIFANSGLNAPHGLAFDDAGNLYVTNVKADTIEKFTQDGIGSVFADAEDGLSHPVDLAFDAEGNLYVTNAYGGSVERFTPDGLGSVFADSGLDVPYGLAFDSAGNLYVSNYGSSTIEEFAPDGTDLGVFASAGLSDPHGMWSSIVPATFMWPIMATARSRSFPPQGRIWACSLILEGDRTSWHSANLRRVMCTSKLRHS